MMGESYNNHSTCEWRYFAREGAFYRISDDRKEILFCLAFADGSMENPHEPGVVTNPGDTYEEALRFLGAINVVFDVQFTPEDFGMEWPGHFSEKLPRIVIEVNKGLVERVLSDTGAVTVIVHDKDAQDEGESAVGFHPVIVSARVDEFYSVARRQEVGQPYQCPRCKADLTAIIVEDAEEQVLERNEDGSYRFLAKYGAKGPFRRKVRVRCGVCEMEIDDTWEPTHDALLKVWLQTRSEAARQES